jgi:hypothetical protein
LAARAAASVARCASVRNDAIKTSTVQAGYAFVTPAPLEAQDVCLGTMMMISVLSLCKYSVGRNVKGSEIFRIPDIMSTSVELLLCGFFRA